MMASPYPCFSLFGPYSKGMLRVLSAVPGVCSVSFCSIYEEEIGSCEFTNVCRGSIGIIKLSWHVKVLFVKFEEPCEERCEIVELFVRICCGEGEVEAMKWSKVPDERVSVHPIWPLLYSTEPLIRTLVCRSPSGSLVSSACRGCRP